MLKQLQFYLTIASLALTLGLFFYGFLKGYSNLELYIYNIYFAVEIWLHLISYLDQKDLYFSLD